MRIDTALKLRRALQMRISDLYSAARLGGYPSKVISEKISAMRAENPKAPQWVWSHLDGYKQALNDSLYRDGLIYGGYVDGVFYSTHRNRPDYYEKHGISACDYAQDGKVQNRGHYYPPNEFRKDYRPYFIG